MVKYLGFTRQDHRGFDLEMTCFFVFSRNMGLSLGIISKKMEIRRELTIKNWGNNIIFV
jgi:hypothetical protein